ncbi:MAG: NAD-dependent epimerase/dehydratase family protein [Candidatus Levybacteria bacterium]|nr:NAD-dependent epimerase/dehydratase family protein [Candidatus Levybacteria bacterium]
MKRTIVITGGCGFIGTNISLEAKKRGYNVVVFDSLIRPHTEENAKILKNSGIEIIRGDIRSKEDLARLPKELNGIIHLAANPGIPWSIKWPDFDFETNAQGTINILEHAKKNLTPFIYASTNKIYSEEINLIPVREESTRYSWDFKKINKKRVRKALLEGITEKGINENFPMDSSGNFPHSPYGVSKATGDLYCQEYFHIYGLPTVVNRMSCVYGLYQKGVEDQGWLDWFVRAKINDQPLNIYGDGKQVRDCVFGSDIAELYLLELENINKVQGKVFNIGGGINHTLSLVETIDYLNNKGGKKLKLNHKSWRVADQKIYISDISKVKKNLGWEPKIRVFEGIDKIWNQYKKIS